MAKKLGLRRLRALMQQITEETLIRYNLVPAVNGGSELGTKDKRFSNIYCQDLNMANERGDYTIIEEEEFLSVRNNKTGKLYRLVMEEIEGGE